MRCRNRKMMLFCAKTIVKESHNFELAHLKKKRKKEGKRKKENHYCCLAIFRFSTFLILFHATRLISLQDFERVFLYTFCIYCMSIRI